MGGKKTVHPIRRVDIQDHTIRVYLSLTGTKRKCTFYLITLNENADKRIVYSGTIPKKTGPFSLQDGPDQAPIQAEFQGNDYGGDVVISAKLLKPLTKLFVRVEQTLGIFDESEWVDIAPPSQSHEGIVALIPCYNVATYCKKVIEESALYATNVIVVDDGSRDGTGDILQKLAAEQPRKIHVVTFPQNCGKGVALLEGFKYALSHFDFHVLVTLDGDAQHRPTDIPYLAGPIQKGEELVIGSRLFHLMPFRSRFANGMITFFLRFLYPDAPEDTQSGMRAFSKNLARDIANTIPGGRYEMEFKCLLLALSEQRKIEALPISTLYLEKNISSHFSPLRDSMRILKVLFVHFFQKLFRHHEKK